MLGKTYQLYQVRTYGFFKFLGILATAEIKSTDTFVILPL